ncbi:MAG: hypothetical protein KUG77_22715, partial [Nannocystaceae bacterium]|nr:hypothetical protein [Nannocystaceae bacterium]
MLLTALGLPSSVQAVGDASTRFNLFVPPNDHSSARAVSLIVTNVSTQPATVDIVDDAADGDSDDSVLGVVLAQGQSQIIRLADGAVDDDRGGIRDGDYFRISSDHPVVVQMATASNWQHDWVPAEGGAARGRSFFVYAPPTSGADNDINVFSYEDDTVLSIRDVTVSPLTTTGLTQVDLDEATLVLQATLDQGEDLIVRENGVGLDILDPGRTYWVQTTHPVTVQYGHLGQVSGGNQARDGAGFVPSANGSSAGSLFYFSIPHNPGRESEKELRVVCPEASDVSVFGATSEASDWTLVTTQSVAAQGHMDLVGATSPSFRDSDIYRLEVDPPFQRCTVFEGNWMETGSYGTSDFASGVSSDHGTNLGFAFTAYVGPPGRQLNVVDPLGELTNNAAPSGGLASHLYLYATEDNTSITVFDVDTQGSKLNHTLQIDADEYYDFVIDTAAFSALTSDGDRPYVKISASQRIMVMNGNFNDNWMAFFHSMVPSELAAAVSPSDTALLCGETQTLEFDCSSVSGDIEDVELTVSLPEGVSLSAADPTATVTATSASWQLGTITAASTVSLTRTFDVDCAALGCPVSGLVGMTAECHGTSDGQARTAVASANFSLSRAEAPIIVSFALQDQPDYSGTPPEPGVDIRLQAEFSDPSYDLSIYRATADADADAPQTWVATLDADDFEDTPIVVTQDPYALHYEENRFYRLVVSDGTCSQTMGPLGIQTSSGGSSGEDSGLESNGRLGAALARRAVARSQRPGWMLPADADKLAHRVGTTDATDPDLASRFPELGPAGSAPRNVTPGDLLVLTNATGVAAVDYLDQDSQTVAGALIVESIGELYEHSKALCDRAAGSSLSAVRTSAEPQGQLLRFASQQTKSATGEYAAEMKLYEQSDGRWVVHTAWLHDNYPPVAQGQRVLNVQAWSPRAGYELALLQDVIAHAQAHWGITAQAPEAYIRHASSIGSTVSFELSEGGRDNDLHLQLATRATDGDWVVQALSLATPRSTIEGTGPFAEATLELVDPEGTIVDRAWMSDGAWTVLDDSMWGGATTVQSWSAQTCPNVKAVEDAPDAMRLDGCGRLRADVADFAGVARHLGGGAAPLRSAEFGGVAFWLRSNREIKVCLEDSQKAPEDQACVLLSARPGGEVVQLPLSAFQSLQGCDPVTAFRTALVSFVAIGAAEQELELEVAALTFTQRAPTQPSVAASCESEEDLDAGCGC